jgi:hypothetical protein
MTAELLIGNGDAGARAPDPRRTAIRAFVVARRISPVAAIAIRRTPRRIRRQPIAGKD